MVYNIMKAVKTNKTKYFYYAIKSNSHSFIQSFLMCLPKYFQWYFSICYCVSGL